ncbi:MAG: hypothetical protein HDS94_02390 [Bacteroidales bacterium]|nr:hypothetical protein [Bacteroidales bacterium]
MKEKFSLEEISILESLDIMGGNEENGTMDVNVFNCNAGCSLNKCTGNNTCHG